MAWKISLSPSAKRNIDKLDIQIGRRILKFLHERISPLDDPRSIGDALTGPRLGSYWRYRVGDYRILCEIQDNTLFILSWWRSGTGAKFTENKHRNGSGVP